MLSKAQHITTDKTNSRDKSLTVEELLDNDIFYVKRAYWSAGFDYLSNNVYLGRKDPRTIPYVSPYLSYNFRNGIYVKGIESYQSSQSDPHFDLFTFEFGYTHLFWSSLSVSAACDRYFFSDSSQNIRSTIKNSITLSALFMNNYIEPQASLVLNSDQDNKTDFILTTAIDHTFFLDHDKFNIIPTLSINAGSQNYVNEQVAKRESTRSSKYSTTTQKSKFKILDYEPSIQFMYKTHNWVFLAIPTYSIPVSPSTTTLQIQDIIHNRVVSSHTTVYKEDISNSFFLELDVSHKTYKKKRQHTNS
jgi:hypothetical protein